MVLHAVEVLPQPSYVTSSCKSAIGKHSSEHVSVAKLPVYIISNSYYGIRHILVNYWEFCYNVGVSELPVGFLGVIEPFVLTMDIP